MPLADYPEIQALRTEEKLRLVEELWNDIRSSSKHSLYEQRLREEIDRRLAKFEANPQSGMTLDEVTANVRKAIENARRTAHSA